MYHSDIAGTGVACKTLLSEFKIVSAKIMIDLDAFVCNKSKNNENFKFWSQYLSRFQIVLDLIRADREGLWELHLDAMQRALYEFSAWGCTNYLRWGTVYLEDCLSMPEEVCANFAENHSFSVKQKPGIFTAVDGDHKFFLF